MRKQLELRSLLTKAVSSNDLVILAFSRTRDLRNEVHDANWLYFPKQSYYEIILQRSDSDDDDEEMFLDEDDKRRLEEMTEKDREAEIFKRVEQREILRARFCQNLILKFIL